MKDQHFKVCPQCGSNDVSFLSLGESGMISDICKECNSGCAGQCTFPEMTQEQWTKFRARIKGKNSTRPSR
jgi:hypothetical protein